MIVINSSIVESLERIWVVVWVAKCYKCVSVWKIEKGSKKRKANRTTWEDVADLESRWPSGSPCASTQRFQKVRKKHVGLYLYLAAFSHVALFTKLWGVISFQTSSIWK